MSMDLYVWKAPVTDDADEARALLDRYLEEGDETVFEPSPDIAKMAGELLKLFPTRLLRGEEALAAMSDRERDLCRDIPIEQVTFIDSAVPWTDFPWQQSDRLPVLGMGWSVAGEALDEIQRLARENELLLYDPQGPDVYPPGEPAVHGPAAPPPLLGFVKMAVILSAFAGLTYAAWLIPYGRLRWPLVAVAAFFTAAALFAAYACVAVAFEREPEEGAA